MAKYDEWLTDEGLIKIEGWARDGLTDEQIARNMGISTKTLYNWKEKFLPILQSLKKGKEVVDRQVENALLNNALGYSYKEQQGFKLKRVYYDENGKRCEEERLETVEVERHKPAETTAQIFWLKNRKRDEWKDRHDTNLNLNPAELTDEEIDELVNKYGSTD